MKCCGKDMSPVKYTNLDDGWCEITWKCYVCGSEKKSKEKI